MNLNLFLIAFYYFPYGRLNIWGRFIANGYSHTILPSLLSYIFQVWSFQSPEQPAKTSGTVFEFTHILFWVILSPQRVDNQVHYLQLQSLEKYFFSPLYFRVNTVSLLQE